MAEKQKFYKWIKLAGFLSFVPLILAAGPISGYVAGEYLEKKFNFPGYVLFICIGIGFVVSLIETVKIIKAAIKTEDKD